MDGWYFTVAAKNLVDAPNTADFVKRFATRFGTVPLDYSIQAYDAALVTIDAIERAAAAGQPITREAVRDAIASAKVETLQGVITFDENGDIKDHSVSIRQFKHDAIHPLTDWPHQTRYIGPAPEGDAAM
jgi:branched-chain amino acid transport system substrate-binding protein